MKPPKSTQEYLDALPDDKRDTLKKLRDLLRRTLPDAEEVISYSMPAFKQEGIVVWFAAAKNHYAIYVYPRVMAIFKEELHSFSGTKSAIHFSYDKAMPQKLIAKVVKESLKKNLGKVREKKKSRG